MTDYLAMLREKNKKKTAIPRTAKTAKSTLRSLCSSPDRQKKPFFSDAATDPPPFPKGKWRDWTLSLWNGWAVDAREPEFSETLAQMPPDWRYHVAKHRADVDWLRQRAKEDRP